MIRWLVFTLLFAVPVAVVARAIYRRIYRFSERSVHDVIPFVREIRLVELEGLLDFADESYLRANMSHRQFRKAQQKRMRLLLEYLRCMSHNTSVLLDWGRSEQQRSWAVGNNDLRQLTTDLIRACIEFRSGARAIQTQLHVWLFKITFFPSAAVPSICGLRKIESFDLLDSYEALKNAAAELGHAFGDYQQRVKEAL